MSSSAKDDYRDRAGLAEHAGGDSNTPEMRDVPLPIATPECTRFGAETAGPSPKAAASAAGNCSAITRLAGVYFGAN